ncbi:unnamed protein product [Prunus armeniaca]
MADFRAFVSDVGLLNLGFAGYPFTWRNRRENGLIQERLDRGLASEPWLRSYSEARVMHVPLARSDHLGLMLSTKPSTTRWHRRFVYDSRWGRQPQCKNVVSERWQKCFQGSRGDQFIGKLGWVRTGFVQWRRIEGRNSSEHITLLRQQLQSAYTDQNFNGPMVRALEQGLKDALREEELFWKQKSRIQWLQAGEKNTKFFHSKVMARRRQNRLMGLEDATGVWYDKETYIHDIAVSYFQDLFTTSRPSRINETVDCVSQ